MMPSDEAAADPPVSAAVLAKAVEKGLLTDGQVLALKSLARQEEPSRRPEPVDPERLRFVSGFADIFVFLGLVLFLGSLAYLTGQSLGTPATGALAAAASWGLAEFFTRRRRMAFPSIALLVAFAGASFVALSGLLGSGRHDLHLGWLGGWLGFSADRPFGAATAALLTAVLCGLHFARFRVPVTIAAGAAALLTAALLALYGTAPDTTVRFINLVLLAGGVLTFALAMRFDLRDPARLTRRTDIAFWLHMLAAPLIVHSVFSGLGLTRNAMEPLSAAAILVVFVVLAVVAIAVDRRAILVSGLTYVGAAFGSLIARAGLTERVVPLTLLGLGALVLLLSAGWQPLRRLLLPRLSAGLANRLPPTQLPAR